MPSRDEVQTPSIQVIGRMFALLDALSQNDQAVALKTLSERTGLHPSTAHRILNDLALGGMVERPSSGHYRLGVRLIQLGNRVRTTLDLRAQALGPARELHRQIRQPITLHVRQDDHLQAWPLGVSARGLADTWASTPTPGGDLHESALGLLMLNHQPGQEAQAGPTPSLKLASGALATAGLVFNDTGHAIAALTIPAEGTVPDSDHHTLLRETADKITRSLGGMPPPRRDEA